MGNKTQQMADNDDKKQDQMADIVVCKDMFDVEKMCGMLSDIRASLFWTKLSPSLILLVCCSLLFLNNNDHN